MQYDALCELQRYILDQFYLNVVNVKLLMILGLLDGYTSCNNKNGAIKTEIKKREELESTVSQLQEHVKNFWKQVLVYWNVKMLN